MISVLNCCRLDNLCKGVGDKKWEEQNLLQNQQVWARQDLGKLGKLLEGLPYVVPLQLHDVMRRIC
jgi:hypothetical protein